MSHWATNPIPKHRCAAPLLTALLLVSVLAGCLAWRGMLEPVVLELPENPEGGPAIVIGRVSDTRSFANVGHSPREPSLYFQVPNDPEVTRRIVGRRRGAKGGNLFLPEDQRVGDLVRRAVTRAFRESGYRVLEGTTAETDAPRVDVTILRLWTWLATPVLSLPTFRSELVVIVDAPFEPFLEGMLSCGDATVVRGSASAGTWRYTLTQALEDLVSRLTIRIQQPPESLPSWFCNAPRDTPGRTG
jgi:hypothetical protein